MQIKLRKKTDHSGSILVLLFFSALVTFKKIYFIFILFALSVFAYMYVCLVPVVHL